MNDPLARAQEIVEDECIATDEDVEIIRALVEIAKAARAYREHEEREPERIDFEAAQEWESLLYQQQSELDAALSVLDDREEGAGA